MNIQLRFSRSYFILTLLLFGAEVFIGAYMHDSFIRPHGGDLLIVILIYCFLQAFIQLPVLPTCIGVLLYAYLIETGQYFHILNLLGRQNSKFAAILLGTTFSWMDMLCYTIGIAVVYALEKWRGQGAKYAEAAN